MVVSGYNIRQMQAVVNNLLTNYQLQGKGKLVLLLHGWGDNSLGSQALQAELAKNFTVLAPDLPGFGKTQAPDAGWDFDSYVDFTGALLSKLNLEQPYAVIGHSNGGAIAIKAVATGILQPQRLVLLAASGIRKPGSPRRVLLGAVAKVGKVLTALLPRRYRSALRRRLYASAGSDMLAVEGMEEVFKKVVRYDVQTYAAQLALPTLLVFGNNDEAVPPSMAKRYNTLIKDSQLQMIDASHFVHLDQPQLTNSLIQDFLK